MVARPDVNATSHFLQSLDITKSRLFVVRPQGPPRDQDHFDPGFVIFFLGLSFEIKYDSSEHAK